MFWSRLLPPLRPAAFVVGVAALALVSVPAQAAVTDSPHFKALGMIIVWGGDASGQPIASDFILDTQTGAGDQDLIAGDVTAVVTGSLLPPDAPISGNRGAPVRIRSIAGGGRVDADSNLDGVMDANDSFGSFALRNSTDNRTRRMELQSSFYVASNEAFHIDAVATPVGTTTVTDLERVRGTLSVTRTGNDGIAFGSAARFPHTAGATGGRRMNGRRLSTMTGGWTVFRGNQSTAEIRGTLAEQSVRFDVEYRYNFGVVDLSEGTLDIEAEVIYTLYIP